MSKVLPDFLSDEQSSTPAADTAPVADAAPAVEAALEAAPAAEGQPRGPDGKFAPVTPEAQAPALAEAAPAAQAPTTPVPSPQDSPFAPLAALLDEREKRQNEQRQREVAEKELRELREWRQQQETKARQQPTPDPAQDPEGFRAFRDAQIQGALWEQRREISHQFAVIKHGEGTVTQAFDWGVQRCDADPTFNFKVSQSKDPVGFVVAEWQRDQLLSAMTPEKIAAFQAWEAAQASAPAHAAPSPQLAAAPAAPPAQPAAPRPSLVSAPSAASTSAPIVKDGEATFATMFGT